MYLSHSLFGWAFLIAGLLSIAIASILDFLFRSRMTRAGHKWALLKGGAFDYSRYHDEAKRQGWPSWPVYVMWALVTVGILLSVVGCFAVLGTGPSRSK